MLPVLARTFGGASRQARSDSGSVPSRALASIPPAAYLASAARALIAFVLTRNAAVSGAATMGQANEVPRTCRKVENSAQRSPSTVHQ